MAVLLALFGYGAVQAWRLAAVGSAFTAKYLCSEVFVAGRVANEVARIDLPAFRSRVLDFSDWHVNEQAGTVTAKVLGMGRRQAVYRQGLGCTVAFEGPLADPSNPVDAHSDTNTFPSAASPPDALRQVVDEAFSEPDPDKPRRTRALLVIQDGKVLAERYAAGFSPSTRFPGWSMSKSVTSALIGILVGMQRLHLDAPAPMPEWAAKNDPRHAITLDHLLHMSSGLAFEEDYGKPLGDVVWMLYGTGDGAAFAAAKTLAAQPGSRFKYSSGTSQILSRILRQAAGRDYPSFARRSLFDPIGAHSFVVESDASGTPAGSSFVFATARDWARFGLLYLNDGMWEGRRILPEGWVRYSVTPAPAAPDAEYGAHFWLKVPPPHRMEPGRPHLLPADAFHAVGHGGQFVTLIPSRRLVVVRLGLAIDPGAWDHEAFVAGLIAALESGSRIGS